MWKGYVIRETYIREPHKGLSFIIIPGGFILNNGKTLDLSQNDTFQTYESADDIRRKYILVDLEENFDSPEYEIVKVVDGKIVES